MSASGYSLDSAARAVARAESFALSLVPWPRMPKDPADLVDVRLRPGETREFNLNFDPTAVFMQVAYRFQIKNEYAGPQLTGVLDFDGLDTANPIFTGIGTLFTTELSIGDTIWYVSSNGSGIDIVSYVTVKKILSDTAFMGDAVKINGTGYTSVYGKMLGRNIPTDWATGQQEDWTAGTVLNTGVVGIGFNADNLVGTGTLFNSELVVGDKIQLFDDNGDLQHYIIASIASDTSAFIHGLTTASATDKAYTRFYTRYSDIEYQIFDSTGKSFGSKLNVQANQGAFGSIDLLKAIDGILHRPYWLGRREAIILRMKNLTNDARRVHGHVYTVRVLT
jgi:hypothetical protein